MDENNKLTDQELDDLFRRSMSEHEEPLWEEAWPLMKDKLTEKKDRKIGFIWFRVAAIFLLIGAFGYFMLQRESSPNQLSQNSASENEATKTDKAVKSEGTLEGTAPIDASNTAQDSNKANEEKLTTPENLAEHKKVKVETRTTNDNKRDKKDLKIEPKEDVELAIDYAGKREFKKKAEETAKVKADGLTEEKLDYTSLEPIHVKSIRLKTLQPQLAYLPMSSDTVLVAVLEDTLNQNFIVSEQKYKPRIKSTMGNRFSLALGLAPDLSKIKGSSFGKMGHNFQLMLGYQLTPKIGVNAGIVHSLKFYEAYPADYNWPAQWSLPNTPLQEIDATCSMLDIPVGVNLTLLEKPMYKMYTHTGLTSYLMLNERYDYHYENEADPSIKWRKWEGKSGFYAASVVNLSVGLERNISRGVSVQLEPFAKIPLNSIGFGDVRLMTSGVYLRIKTDFKKY